MLKYKEFTQKQVHLVYEDDKENIVKQFIDEINELNDILKLELTFNDEDQLMSSIKKSDALIIFSTGILSEKLQKEYECAKAEKKIILPVTISSMFKSQDFRTIEINEPISKDSNKESFKKFNSFLHRSLQIRKNGFFEQGLIDFKAFSIKYFDGDQPFFKKFEIISEDESLIQLTYNGFNFLKLINNHTGNIISVICQAQGKIMFSWINHLNQVLVVYMNNGKSALKDKNGKIIRFFPLCLEKILDLATNITLSYNKFNKKTFIRFTTLNGSTYFLDYDVNFDFTMFNERP